MDLLIVESPTKAKTITRFLPKGNKVVATKGHIRDLPKSRMGVDIGSFEPEYITIRGKGSVISDLKKEAKKAEHIYIATDNDREGEAIAWHVSQVLDVEGKENRIEFNEITKKSILNAIKSPRRIDRNLVDAQQARRVLDRVVGYSISPILWKKVKNKLSAGRVQSVALMLICNRENEINAFVPTEYWTIKAIVGKDNGIEFELKQIIKNGKAVNIEIPNEKEKDKIIALLNKGEYIIKENSLSTRKKQPYPPFTTSLMQQEANRKLGFKSSLTMSIAQALYEGVKMGSKGHVGLITYMRTDSYRLSEDSLAECGEFIKSNYGEKYYSGKRYYSNKKKNTQDAHEAIRPTDVNNTPAKVREYLSDTEYKLYKLIWNRFVQSQMADANVESNKLSLQNEAYVFKAESKRLLFDGYMKVNGIDYGFTDMDLSGFKEGAVVHPEKLDAEQNFTKPPARYTEASLIKVLEEDGIGRPSTYAPTISTLLSRYYVKLENKVLIPTELGIIVNDIIVENFPSVINKEFTANMENILDEISVGDKEWHKVLKDFYKLFDVDLKKAETEIEKIELKDEVSDVKCELCGRMMVIKRGPFGKFLACPGYPECKNTKSIIEEVGIKCPKCNKGNVVKRKSKTGRVFYGCSRYPECDFIVSDKPIEEKCPNCNGLLLERNYAGYKLHKCNDCDYKEKIIKNTK